MKRIEAKLRERAVIAPLLLLCAGACTGRITSAGAAGGGSGEAPMGGAGAQATGAGGAGGTTSVTNDGWPGFGATTAFQLRRLTTEQYTTSSQTLLGVSAAGMPPIEEVSPVGGFSAIGAASGSVSGMGVAQFEDAARFLAHAAFASDAAKAKLVPCTPTGVADTTCLGSFVTTFGPRAFRRPLTADETTRYTAAVAQAAQDLGDPWQALEAITSAFLQSPNFIYMAEVGAPDPQSTGRLRFTSYEMASRLAYFLTNDAPDDALLTAAAADALLTPAGVQAQATRLLALPEAHTAVGSFFRALLALDNLETLTRPVELFPKYTPTIGPAMKQETLSVVDDLVFASDGDYRHLFDQTDTFVNAELAGLYGVPAPTGAGFSRVTLPASAHRAGLLGQAGVLAARDHADGTSPTRRGLFVLTRLICQDLPLAPPANLTIPPPPTGKITARQRLTEHASNAVCAACHQQTDPVGLALEHFDAMGVWRDTDQGLAIDDTGSYGGQTFQGEIGLGAMLRDHPALEPCLVQALYGVGVGHLATEFDRATFTSLVHDFGANGARVKGLLASIVASDGFRYLPKPM
jgi:Protein of unknown function (DUF1592)/Protein of unknown function (DUF1588)/Protein of unknown function (DUF1595)/Protein of unknown function (DUF1585)